MELEPLPLLRLAGAILLLTLFVDVLELSFARILWFIKTLRFWLYFVLHYGLSILAAYFLHAKLTEWYILAPAATFLGVGVISNTNVNGSPQANTLGRKSRQTRSSRIVFVPGVQYLVES